VPAIPGSLQAGGGQAAGANTLSGADIMRVLRQNALLIISLLVTALILGFVVNQYILKKYWPQYTAQTFLLVKVPRVHDPSNTQATYGVADQSATEMTQKTYAQQLLHPSLFKSLIEGANSPIRTQTTWIKQFEVKGTSGETQIDVNQYVEKMRDAISVVPIPETQLIDIKFRAATKSDAKVILDQIVDQFEKDSASETLRASASERLTYRTMADEIGRKLTNLGDRLNKQQARLNVGDENVGKLGTIGMRELEMGQLISERLKSQDELEQVASSFRNLSEQLDSGNVPASVTQMVNLDPTIQRLKGQLDDLQLRYAVDAQQFGVSHKSVKNVEVSLDVVKQKYQTAVDEQRVNISTMMREQAQSEVQSAQAKFDQIQRAIGGIEQQIGELNREMTEYLTGRDEQTYLGSRLKDIEERIAVIDANSNNPARVTVTGMTAEEPTSMSFPKLPVTLLMSGVLGLGLSLGIAFLRELMDTRVRSPRDISKVGQLNMLGMIPHVDDDPQAAAGELSLAISQAPHSIIAENFRQVRTRLQHAASLDTTRSLLVTSPGPGDGKSTVAANIAAGLALNGRKILIVDANFRRPDLHRIFGVGNDVGFGNVLQGQIAVEAAAKKSSVPNLDVLPTGPRPANPTELLESQLLTDFIDRALEEYDHVIFDAGPILLVSETVALAPRVDGVVSVVRANANSRGLLTRMRDTLRQLKAEHLGVVLNGVRAQGGGYYGRNIKNYYAYQAGSN
jgi:polysaccharide biosynthesis transport protein